MTIAPPSVAAVLQPASGLQMIGRMEGSGYRNPPSLVRRADGQTIQLTPLLYTVLASIDGKRDAAAVAEQVSREYGRTVSAADVQLLAEQKLRPLGLLRGPDGEEPEVKRSNPLLALRFRMVMSNPRVTRRVTAPFAWLFHPVVVAASVIGFAAVIWWVLWDRGLAFAANRAFAHPGLLLAVFVASLLSAGFHEFGHAAAARYGGATPGAIGAGLYLVWPAFYTDVTDTYRLNRRGRIRTDLGGLYFNAVAALVVFGLWWITAWEPLLLLIATQVLQMIRQLPPLLRFDGYHLLADITGVPDLYHRIWPTLAGILPTRWGKPGSRDLKTWAKAVVLGWVVAVVPFMLVSVLVAVVTVPRLVATAWSSLGLQWDSMLARFSSGDTLGAIVKLLDVFAVILPVGGVFYMLARLVRRVGVGTWRSTAGRPVHRTGAAVTAFAALGALAFAWWPHGDYRPIQPYEHGSISEAVPAVLSTIEGTQGRTGPAVETVWPAGNGPLPTRSHPALALVLIPVKGAPAGATPWVFPFNRPAPPGPGDNQALAVNTTDGSTVYKVAFALVWVQPGQNVLNSNGAYAFADCHACQTTAVAFQVVLVVGNAPIVVPQNLSGALNFDCVYCLTEALAQQLVLTQPSAPTQQEAAAIAAIWQQVEQFGQSLQGLSLAQIQSTLSGFESQIQAVVQQYAPPGTTGTLSQGSSTATTVSGSSTTVGSSGGASSTTPSTAGPSSTDASTTQGSTSSTSPDTSTTSPPSTTTPPSTAPPST